MLTNNENHVPEVETVHNQMGDRTAGKLEIPNQIIRLTALGLQIVSMLAYYLPSIIRGGEVGVLWLLIGVVQTFVFSVVFFRDRRTYRSRSIVLMVIGTVFNIAMLIFIFFHSVLGDEVGLDFSFAFIYAFCSLIALVLALCFPRKYRWQQPGTVVGSNDLNGT